MDARRLTFDESLRADDPHAEGHTHEALPDLAYRRIVFVNVVFVGQPGAGDRGWVLVDAGVTGASEGKIREAAEERFGKEARPSAIVLTHGHFDHVGAARELADEWDCPIYAHPLEMPYVSGHAAYPSGDPSVGGGMMALSSKLYPDGPFDLGPRLRELPADGAVPGLSDWRWIAAPGHSVGQVVLWRESDRALIAADAFVTTDQESLYAAVSQKLELQGPPMYYTVDWPLARDTVRRLAALEPETVVTGHGRAVAGARMRSLLHELASDFDRIAVPEKGKYVERPRKVEDGSAYVS